jgi:hypothetical protein
MNLNLNNNQFRSIDLDLQKAKSILETKMLAEGQATSLLLFFNLGMRAIA